LFSAEPKCVIFSDLFEGQLLHGPSTFHTNPDQLPSTSKMTAKRSAKTLSFFGSFFSLGQQRKK
jgi:hypothetical protein